MYAPIYEVRQIVTPSWSEFRNFGRYIEKVINDDFLRETCGAAIIRPPPEFRPRIKKFDPGDYLNEQITIHTQKASRVMGKKKKGKKAKHEEGVYKYTSKTQEPKTIKEFLDTNFCTNPGYTLDEIEGENGHKKDAAFWNLIKTNSHKSKVVLEYSTTNNNNYFDDCAGEWNMNHLKSILPALRNEAPDFDGDGIATSFVYYGSWGTFFPLHVENGNLNSLNYHFWGEPKTWYTIGEGNATAVERVVAELFPLMATCPAFISHKMCLLHPSVFIKRGIPVYRLVQRPGDFVVTSNLCYHTGFNFGTNCTQAVNFGSMRWPAYQPKLDRCTCTWKKGDEIAQLPIDFMARERQLRPTRKRLSTGCCDYVARDVDRVVEYMKENPSKAWTLAQSIKERKRPEHRCEETLTSMYVDIITQGGKRVKKLGPTEVQNLRNRLRRDEYYNLFQEKCPPAYLMDMPPARTGVKESSDDGDRQS